MDTEEDHKIQQAALAGKSQTDEGPYYHTSWWESYKGGVKGKLGGVVVGAGAGAVMGVIAAVVVSALATGGISLAVGAAIAGGFSAAGMAYGAHEFSEVGKVTGAVAAAHEKSEERMKSFENGKFAELKKEISDLKSIITGKKAEPDLATDAAIKAAAEHTDYAKSHMDDKAAGFAKPIFWKIAAIGLTIGLAVGALLAFGGVTEHLFGALGHTTETLPKIGEYALSMTAMGAFGASFGINRDIFRGVFDRTDRLFKGVVSPSREPAKAIETPQVAQAQEAPVTTVVYENIAYPQSDTHHRDRVLAQAKQALMSLDHTKAIPH